MWNWWKIIIDILKPKVVNRFDLVRFKCKCGQMKVINFIHTFAYIHSVWPATWFIRGRKKCSFPFDCKTKAKKNYRELVTVWCKFIHWYSGFVCTPLNWIFSRYCTIIDHTTLTNWLEANGATRNAHLNDYYYYHHSHWF